jgi:hypothetical protein
MYPAAVLLTQRRLEISDCAGSPQEARRGLVHRYRIVWRCKAFRRRWWCCEEGRCGCGKRRRATGSHGASTAVFHDDTFTRQTTSSSPFPPFPFVPFVVRASLAPARGSLVWVELEIAAPLPGTRSCRAHLGETLRFPEERLCGIREAAPCSPAHREVRSRRRWGPALAPRGPKGAALP